MQDSLWRAWNHVMHYPWTNRYKTSTRCTKSISINPFFRQSIFWCIRLRQWTVRGTQFYSRGPSSLQNEEINFKNELPLLKKNSWLKSKKSNLKRSISISYTDPLSNLPNRRKFHDHLSSVLAKGGRGSVVLLDLDNFKGINDTLVICSEIRF